MRLHQPNNDDNRPFYWETLNPQEKLLMDKAGLEYGEKSTDKKMGNKKQQSAKHVPSQNPPQDEEDTLGTFDSCGTERPWPSDPGKEAYHGLAGDVVNSISPHSEASREALLIQFLVAFGNLIGRHAYRVIGGSRHHCNLFGMLVGKTGKGRKGTSWAWIERFIKETEVEQAWVKDRIMNGLSSGEGVVYALRDPVHAKEAVKNKKSGLITTYQDTIKDHGVEDKRLLIVEEEFASVLRVGGRESNILSAVLRQLWDGKQLGNLTKNSPHRATDAHGSLLGHITQFELLETLKSNDKANGYCNRFLWVCARRSKILPDGGGIPQWQQKIDEFKVVVEHARAKDREMTRDAATVALWHEVYPHLSQDRPGVLGLVTNRAEAQVSRLAMIYALLDGTDRIEKIHLQAALALWDYCERSCAWIFGEGTGNRHADALLRELRRRGGMTQTEIYNFFGKNKSIADIKMILEPLVEARLVIPGKPAVGGKPAERWRVL
jgi:hypothetical protein